MFTEEEIQAAYEDMTNDFETRPINLKPLMLECFRAGVHWAQSEFLHHLEDNQQPFVEHSDVE